jgi:hypothetical protein
LSTLRIGYVTECSTGIDSSTQRNGGGTRITGATGSTLLETLLDLGAVRGFPHSEGNEP